MKPMLKQVLPNFIELEIQSSPEEAVVTLSPDQIERMVLNLVRNSSMAFEGRRQGKITVSVSTSNEVGVPSVCIAVNDNGVGMDEETKERAIEPYFSIRGSTGLGLSTVHGLIEQVGGTLEIFSRVGEGTMIKLWMPMSVETGDLTSVPLMERTTDMGTVLLIDDEELVRDAVKVLLENLGWRVIAVGNSQQAQDVVSKPVDIALIVCDVRLGDEQGFDVVNVLKQVGIEAPVLYITGYASRSHQGLQDNAHLLVKPFLSEDLDKAIQTVLG